MSDETGPTLEYSRCGRGTEIVLRVEYQGDAYTEKMDVAKSVHREKVATSICTRWPALERQDVLRELDRVATQLANHKDSEAMAVAEMHDPQKLLAAMPDSTRKEALSMLRAPDLFNQVLADIAAMGVAGESDLTGTVYIVGTSRLLESPLAAIVQGQSASGKSYLIQQTAKLFPPEAVLHATQMTPQALFHMPPQSLVHRFIVAGERSRRENDESAEATRALREMLSSGKLAKLIPMKDEHNKIVTAMLEQDGPIAYVESTTLSNIFNEDANRCLMLQTDERPEQTRNIICSIAEGAIGKTARNDCHQIMLKHHAAQRIISRVPVKIPFANALARAFPTERVEARRAFKHVISMIEAITLLHQLQRDKDGTGAIISTTGDYLLAKRLLDDPMSRLLGRKVSNSAGGFYERLKAIGLKEFGTNQAAEGLAVGPRTIRNWLAELNGAGLITQVQPPRGPSPAVWKLVLPTTEDNALAALPALETLLDSREQHSCAAQELDTSGFKKEDACSAGNSASLHTPSVAAGKNHVSD